MQISAAALRLCGEKLPCSLSRPNHTLELTDEEWTTIKPMLPDGTAGCGVCFTSCTRLNFGPLSEGFSRGSALAPGAAGASL